MKRDNNTARLPYLKPADMEADLKAFYDDIVASFDQPGLPHITKLEDGEMIGPFTSMLNFPEYGELLFRLQSRIVKQSDIPKDICEIFILVITCAEGAAYATYAHELLAIDSGVSANVVKMIKAGKRPVFDSPATETAFALASALVKKGTVPQDIYDQAFTQFGPKGLNTLIHTAALFKYLSTLMNAYDEPVPVSEES